MTLRVLALLVEIAVVAALAYIILAIAAAAWREHRRTTAWYQPCDKCQRLLLVRPFLQPSGQWRDLAKCTSCWHFSYPDQNAIHLPYIRSTNAPRFEPYPQNATIDVNPLHQAETST